VGAGYRTIRERAGAQARGHTYRQRTRDRLAYTCPPNRLADAHAQNKKKRGVILTMNSDYRIRLARPDDIPELPQIEQRAALLFSESGFAGLLTNIMTPEETLKEGVKSDRLWVAADKDDRPVGFALACVVGGNAHLDELDVYPEHCRRGLGSVLVETVCDWAQQSGFKAITLTTFGNVPWNAPFYERLGFRTLSRHEMTEALNELMELEIKRGLPGENRVAMTREL